MSIAPAMFGTLLPTVLPATSWEITPARPALREPATSPERSGISHSLRNDGDPWFSGWCSDARTCQDSGKRCKGYVRNGSKAARPMLYCDCGCHTTTDEATVTAGPPRVLTPPARTVTTQTRRAAAAPAVSRGSAIIRPARHRNGPRHHFYMAKCGSSGTCQDTAGKCAGYRRAGNGVISHIIYCDCTCHD